MNSCLVAAKVWNDEGVLKCLKDLRLFQTWCEVEHRQADIVRSVMKCERDVRELLTPYFEFLSEMCLGSLCQ